VLAAEQITTRGAVPGAKPRRASRKIPTGRPSARRWASGATGRAWPSPARD